MYLPTAELFGQLLNRPRTETDPGVRVFDTHSRPALPSYKPDLCICLGGTEKPDSTAIYVAVELKHVNNPIDDEDRGQVLDYLVAMHKIEPSRCILAALLSDLHINHVILLRKVEGGGMQLVNHVTTTLAKALTFLKQVVLVDTRYCPPMSVFPSHLGTVEARLGNPKISVVGEFKMSNEILEKIKSRWPDEAKALGRRMAVKVLQKRLRTTTTPDESNSGPGLVDVGQSNEIMIYQRIQREKKPSANIARMVYYSPDLCEVGIAPIGTNIDLGGISSPGALRTILGDVLNGIKWLQDHGILHRDIRRDNVIVVSSETQELHGKIIDFGASIVREDGETSFPLQKYLGGYICCPREVIGDFSRLYYPCPSHDYLAWVMLVNFLVFPTSVPYLQSHRVAFESVEAERLENYWLGMEMSRMWGGFVSAAKHLAKDELVTLMDGLLIML